MTAGSGKKVYWLCEHGHSWEAQINRRANGNGCPYCSGRYPIAGETDLVTMYPEIAAEWDNELNGNLHPTDVSAGSGRRVFWRCKSNHSWYTTINHRTRGEGCPYCMGRQPVVGETDLATLYPEISAEWDYDRNRELCPTNVLSKSNKEVFWRCKFGHSWEASINNRTSGHGCPYCAGQRPISGVSDLATMRPEIAAEWDYDRNGDLSPSSIAVKSNKKVFWRCSFGHSWEAIISNRARGDKCPYCSGKSVITGETDLATMCPEIAAEWDYDRNEDLLPTDVFAKSRKSVYWCCEKGHSWKARIDSRTCNNSGCPFCDGHQPHTIRFYDNG